jgi:copper transport protein
MSAHPHRCDRDRVRPAYGFGGILVLLIALVGVVSIPSTASAHTGFDSSMPAEGAIVEQPVELVTVVFTGEATPVGDQFVALTPAGVIQPAVSVQTVDDKVFSLRFDPPLAGGQVGLRWSVQAADAHPIEGAFSFTVNAPAPALAQAAAASAETPTVDAAAPVDGSGVPAAAPASLDEFLTVDDSKPGETTATIGRVVGFTGITLGLGTLAFLATTLRGRRQEVRRAVGAVRMLGVVIAVGAAIEYVGVTRIAAGSLMSGWSTAPGFATVLRVVGGVALAVGVVGSISRGRATTGMPRSPVARSLSSAVLDDLATEPSHAMEDGPIVRWVPDARSWPAFAGAVLVIASFWFDGHTVSKGFRPLHAVVNSVHVAAGAVWVGGVVAMAVLVWSRYRSGRSMRVAELVVRFSKVATVALASVVVAGGLMAFLVLDSVGDLTGTQWGKMLLLKTAAVVLAMVAGAYNHFRLLPALETDAESPDALAQLRTTLTVEAMMLGFVVIVTAFLVAAAT